MSLAELEAWIRSLLRRPELRRNNGGLRGQGQGSVALEVGRLCIAWIVFNVLELLISRAGAAIAMPTPAWWMPACGACG